MSDFYMDSFDRSSAVYCCNNAGVEATSATKFLDLNGLKTYDRLVQERDVSADRVMIDDVSLSNAFDEIVKRLEALEGKRVSAVSPAFGMRRLKRADLNLVFGCR